jgi:hypothetical protein
MPVIVTKQQDQKAQRKKGLFFKVLYSGQKFSTQALLKKWIMKATDEDDKKFLRNYVHVEKRRMCGCHQKSSKTEQQKKESTKVEDTPMEHNHSEAQPNTNLWY